MSTLENLKKQAKALVRLHAERSYHLSSVAREVLPGFTHLTDRELLAGPFKLADAQELLARQHGCESWSALKSRLEAGEFAAPPPRTEGSDIELAVPVLYVASITGSLGYYAKLGFEPVQVSGEPPYYAEVKRDSAVLALRLVHGPAFAPEMAEETMLLQAILRVANAKALYLEFLAAGVEFDVALRREPWGSLFFVIRDPDANKIGFGEPARGPGS